MATMIKPADIHCSVNTSYDQLKGVFSEFEHTPLHSHCSLLNTWYKHYWQKDWQLICYVFYHHQQLVCIAPFYLKIDDQLPFVKTLHLIGQGEPEQTEAALEYLDIYITHGYENIMNSLILEKINSLNFDQFIIKAVFENSCIAKLAAQFNGTLTKQQYAQYKVNNTLWQFSQLSKNTRSRINRCKNQLERLGATFRWLNSNEYNKTWELLKKYHQSRWQNKGKTGAFYSPDFNSFHRTLRENSSDMIAMSAVFINKQPIAINYYLVTQNTYHFYQSGWDELNYSQLSPGLFLHYWSLSNCPKKYYDFMMGGLNNSYKAKFQADERAMLAIKVVRSPIKLFISKVLKKITNLFFSRFINK